LRIKSQFLNCTRRWALLRPFSGSTEESVADSTGTAIHWQQCGQT